VTAPPGSAQPSDAELVARVLAADRVAFAIVYDRYGQVVSREDHLIQLNVKPDVYPIFEKNGVQLHGAVKVPKGDYWLRTGIYDERTRKVGTMEVPLRLVKDEVASR